MRPPYRLERDFEGAPSTDPFQRFAEALAAVGAFLLHSRTRPRKSAIKVRGGRARARSAVRDERGRFAPDPPNDEV